MVVRSGCGVTLVGYMSGRYTAQSLGYQQGVSLMALYVCYINEFKRYFKVWLVDFCDDVEYFLLQTQLVPKERFNYFIIF